MNKLFLISGLGADRRLFNKLDLPGYELVHVDWIEPESSDTISSYAHKLIQTYYITNGANVLGVSLGGVMTVEISTLLNLRKAIIISSIKSADEIPAYFKFFRKVPIYKIIPHGFYTTMGGIIKPLFGDTKGKAGSLFADMIKNTSPAFMRWAMHAILHWLPKPLNAKIYHIIGNKDLIFPHRRITTATHIVNEGSHDMVYTRGAEISKLIQSILNEEVA
ncbi:alpha/beta hydrolase [uncultured Mucilaginibacter sp.]|uniref:alpha/beta hydrolase n=1 Tax=uncultured Mucilaginibacter sp. TaxID=797541 RepID=UPI0025EFF924|nr:alpha/beta hydrolase [uncultured Mucilaginibacter sp.]